MISWLGWRATEGLMAKVGVIVKKIWQEWIKVFLMVALVMGTFRSAVADWNDVPTPSMTPTIMEGDRIFVNKLAYGLRVPFTRIKIATWAEPVRGDIIVFASPADGIRLVKRVVGIPGDTIALRNNRLFINGIAVTYEPLDGVNTADFQQGDWPARILAKERLGEHLHPVMITPVRSTIRSFGPMRIPDGQYFVMGDNRDESRDSRFFGLVDRDRLYGRATAVAASVNPSRHDLPRWQRFFRSLP
jgi:signal peptidase I